MSKFAQFWTRYMYNPEAETRLNHFTALLLRIVFGAAMIIGHGWGKFANFAERTETFSDPLGLSSAVSLTLATFAEFFCSLGLIFGVATRLVLIPLMVTMLVAIFAVHLTQPFARMEKAILYLTVFIVLMLTGPGKYAIDAAIARKVSD